MKKLKYSKMKFGLRNKHNKKVKFIVVLVMFVIFVSFSKALIINL